jgi:type II secretion system protein I
MRADLPPQLQNFQRGFTMIETLVAMTIFALVSAAMLPAFVSQLRYNHRSELKTGAIQVAQLTLERLRLENPEDMPTLGADEEETVSSGERDYNVTITYCADMTYCGLRSRFVTVSVELNDEELYEVSTIFTRLR